MASRQVGHASSSVCATGCWLLEWRKWGGVVGAGWQGSWVAVGRGEGEGGKKGESILVVYFSVQKEWFIYMYLWAFKQVDTLKSYTGDISKLGQAEDFYRQLIALKQ